MFKNNIKKFYQAYFFEIIYLLFLLEDKQNLLLSYYLKAIS